MEKRCTGCYEYKVLDEYHNNKKAGDGKTSKCKDCRSKRENRKLWNKTYYDRKKSGIKSKVKPFTLFDRIKRDKLQYCDLTPEEKFEVALKRIDILDLEVFSDIKRTHFSIVFKNGIEQIYKSFKSEKKMLKNLRYSKAVLAMIKCYEDNPTIPIDVSDQSEYVFIHDLYDDFFPGIKKNDYGANIDRESMLAIITFKNKYKLKNKTTVVNLIAMNWKNVTFDD